MYRIKQDNGQFLPIKEHAKVFNSTYAMSICQDYIFSYILFPFLVTFNVVKHVQDELIHLSLTL